MPGLYTSIGPLTLQTFTLALAVSILASAGLALRRLEARGRAADALLGALVGGVIGARLFHVLLNGDYFADNLNEVFSLLAGGLDWHGAVIGGLAGILIVIRWFHRGEPAVRPYTGIHLETLLDALAPALPLVALGGWYGCLAAGCGYGREVDTLANYPPLITAELVDVYGLVAPRFNTPLFGMALAAAGLLLVGVMAAWARFQMRAHSRAPLQQASGRRFWALLAVLSAGMFVIGFFRADHTLMFAGVRGDQWLDVGLVVLSFQRSAISFQQKQRIQM